VIVWEKSSSVLLATGLEGARVSADNRLDGVVSAVTAGAVNAEVSVEADGGVTVVAIVTQASLQALGLAPGARVTALIKASDIVLATAG
jgi:molybdate transport system regulatory protein